ncbi:MAG: helix-turn-helix domain-containing protein [Planctomycetes bacterium]|nr:helix-turn-helix domain-containing protein [Planctomycetota bacterium]
MNVESHHTTVELRTLYRTETNAKLAQRIQGVYLASKGLTYPEIMALTAAARRTIQQWVHKYNKESIAGLRDKPRPGTPTKLPRKKEIKLKKRIAAGPTKADGVSVLNGPAIRRILEREFGVLYSRQGLYDLLHRLGYSCLCPRPQHEKAKPQLQAEFKKTSSKRWIPSNQSTQAKE